MELSPMGIVGAVVLAVAGLTGGYMATGKRDFSVEVGRPLPEVYESFSGIRTFGSGLRNEGFDVPEITTSHPSANELVFTAASANPDQSSRIAFTFEPGANSATTRVTAAIDVPPVQMTWHGERKVLSEDKIEAEFEEAIGEMAKALNQGNSTTEAESKLAMLLDTVAIASNPEVAQKMDAQVQKLEAADRRRREEAFDRRREQMDGFGGNGDLGRGSDPYRNRGKHFGDPGYH